MVFKEVKVSVYLCVFIIIIIITITYNLCFSSGTEELSGAHSGVLYDPDRSVTHRLLAVATHQHHTLKTKTQCPIRSLLTFINRAVPQNYNNALVYNFLIAGNQSEKLHKT